MTEPQPTDPVPAVLAQAYRNALYRIDTVPAITLRINQAHPDLARLHQQYHCGHSLILTACNPRSRRLRPAANTRRVQALRQAVDTLGFPCLPATGLDPQGIWPDEASLWIPGMPLAAGLILARRFGQSALVECPENTVACLIWTAVC
ncbi:DUF3293 domain-containing protein [Castellaniella sp.]|uniref:DUF3293 domain-containing protein n=1 Tax=Castellaniella sp. TaxID=1955812 RepID=UPI002AFE620A|nr:DUF3293 domain-containing protein [Castellaniella sp.]